VNKSKKVSGYFSTLVLFSIALAGCHTAPPAPMHVPSESTQLGRIDCLPRPGSLDSEMYKFEGFALTANRSLLLWSGPTSREDGLQTVTGRVKLTFKGPSDIRYSAERNVVGGLGMIPSGEKLELDAGKIGEWFLELHLYMAGDAVSTLTATRKTLSNKISGTETYRFAAHCQEDLTSGSN
jgi:hypothetical protein